MSVRIAWFQQMDTGEWLGPFEADGSQTPEQMLQRVGVLGVRLEREWETVWRSAESRALTRALSGVEPGG